MSYRGTHATNHALALCCSAAEAKQPEDWDDEEDGDWEAPQVPNPKCKEAPGCGEWKRPTKAVSRVWHWEERPGGCRCRLVLPVVLPLT